MKPIISPRQGHLGTLVGTTLLFQPALSAGESDTWVWTGHPPGATFSATTGLLTISPTSPGVYNATVTAESADEEVSDPVTFYIPVEAAGYSTGPGVDLALDVVTKGVRRLQAPPLVTEESAAGAVSPSAMAAAVATELLRAKAGETVPIIVYPLKGGAGVDLGTPTSVSVTLKEFDRETVIVPSASAPAQPWAKQGSGATASYLVLLTLPALTSVLSNYSDDTGTRFAGRCELVITYPNPYIALVGLEFTVVAATDVLTTTTAHGLAVGDTVQLHSSTTLPAGASLLTTYYVKTVPSATTLTLSATSGGATLDLTTTGTGTHRLAASLRLKSDTFIMTISAPQS